MGTLINVTVIIIAVIAVGLMIRAKIKNKGCCSGCSGDCSACSQKRESKNTGGEDEKNE